MIIIITVLLAVVASIIIIAVIKSKQDEENEYYEAAKNILKEDILDHSLKNPLKNGSASAQAAGQRPMIYVKIEGKRDCKYVFDPSKSITVGREKDCSVCVSEATVSGHHMQIFSSGLRVYARDLNSLNGIDIKRGMKHYTIQSGGSAEIVDGDRLTIGMTTIIITIFYFDTLLM